MSTILAIETSCDETALAVVCGTKKPEVKMSVLSSQIDLHAKTNGIVPEVAAREQLTVFVPLLQELKEQMVEKRFKIDSVEAIAVTKGPGLIGSLAVGVESARTLGLLWQKPVYGIHHIEGHIYAAFHGYAPDKIMWPVLALVVSGGHTMLVLMRKHFSYEIIGTTRDDAAGEAFDKAARLLDLGYPGGPAIAAAAAAAAKSNLSPLAKPLPRPMINDRSFDFSFSGLKTALYYQLRDRQISPLEQKQYAQEVQNAITETLVVKTKRAAEAYGAKTIVLVGGVSANQQLRAQLKEIESDNLSVIVPQFDLTTDNAGMIGIALWYRLKLNQPPSSQFEAKPRLDLTAESVVG